jgi:hypothetical protein
MADQKSETASVKSAAVVGLHVILSSPDFRCADDKRNPVPSSFCLGAASLFTRIQPGCLAVTTGRGFSLWRTAARARVGVLDDVLLARPAGHLGICDIGGPQSSDAQDGGLGV